MLEDMGQFKLYYKGQAQGTLESLMATPSLLSRVMESKGRDTRYCPSGTVYSRIQVMKVRPFTHMVVSGIGDGLWFPR